MQLTTKDITSIITLINLAPVKGADAEEITIIKGKLYALAREIEDRKKEPAPAQPAAEQPAPAQPENKSEPVQKTDKKGKK